MKSSSSETRRSSILYLLRETALILGFSYFVLAGGTLNGVMRFRLRVISQGLLALIFVVWLFARAQKGEKLVRASFDTAMLAFLGVQILAALLSTDPRRSLAFCGQWIAYALWFYLLRDLLRHGWPAELAVKSLLIVSGILVGLGLTGVGAQWIRWAATGDFALPLPLLQQRFYSLLGDPNMTADLLNLLWPLALARLASAQARSARTLLSLWLAAVLFTQLLTRSQGGLVGLVVSTLSTLLLLLLVARPPWFERGWSWFKGHKLALWGLGLSVAGLAGGFMGLLAGGDLVASRGELWTAAWQTFLRSPLWGSGPFTFGTQYMLHASVPPRPAYPHAHNYWLNTVAETGLLGLAASVWVAAALGAALLRRWRRATLPHRALMAGGVGSLTGFAAHSLADNHIVLPGIGLIVIAVLALALTGEEVPSTHPRRSYRLSVVWLGLPALILTLGSFLSGRAYWHYEQGRQLAESDLWADAVPSIERAVGLDPHLAFYRFQSGFAHSVLAADAPEGDHLTAAIEAYERGIILEPNYSLNHANLGVLYGSAGRLEEAIAKLERAVQLAPDANLYHLNLGRLYEAADRVGEAAIEYDRFLTASPDRGRAYYWRQTPFRQRFVQGWQAAHLPPDPPVSSDTAEGLAARGWQAYDAGHYEAALEAFKASFALDGQQSDTAHGLGLAHMALGSYERADFYFGLANFFLVRSNRPDPLLDWGRLAHRQGEIETAIARYEAGLGLVEEYSVYGPGTLGWSPYANFLFQRESIARDLAPQLIRIDVTDDLAARYLELGRWYEELGDSESAAAVYRRVLSRVPDLAAAERRLHALNGQTN
jgi:tetratricopeptide (TPR) repeat protein